MSFTVAIVGRPNVGKSTLFNRLVGRRLALVHDLPGVTRDRRAAKGYLAGLEFTVIDTAGLEEADSDSLEGRMRRQTETAVREADLVLFLIDARSGVMPLDARFADLLRKSETPVVLCANKCEGKAGMPGLCEGYSLGLGEPVPLSAEHGTGMEHLFEALLPYARVEAAAGEEDLFSSPTGLDGLGEDADPETEIETQEIAARARPLRLAIVGRPNTGKSTLINRLLGEDRLLTGPEAGVTRDAIEIDWHWRGRRVRLVDTAGLRRRARIEDALEKMSVARTLDAIRMAEVVILTLDAAQTLDNQDLTIARMVVDEGRALVLALNKWDSVATRQQTLQRLRERLEESLSQLKGIPVVTLSGLYGQGLDKLLEACVAAHALWASRIATGPLNRWLEEALARHPPPLSKQGRRLKLRYITQVKTRPPTFAVFASKPDEMPDSYTRYLSNGLRETFALWGVPLRLFLRKPKNPYVDSSS